MKWKNQEELMGWNISFRGIQNLYENQKYTDASFSSFKLPEKTKILQTSKITPCRSAKNDKEMEFNNNDLSSIMNTKSTSNLPSSKELYLNNQIKFQTPSYFCKAQPRPILKLKRPSDLSPNRRNNHSLINIAFTLNSHKIEPQSMHLPNKSSTNSALCRKERKSTSPYRFCKENNNSLANILQPKKQLIKRERNLSVLREKLRKRIGERSRQNKWNNERKQEGFRSIGLGGNKKECVREGRNCEGKDEKKEKTRFSRKLDRAMKEFIEKHEFYPYNEVILPHLRLNNQSQKSMTGVLL